MADNPNHYDIILIGQGLAGSLLAWQLARTEQKLLLIDAAPPSSASRVAAGLINPVTGGRLVKTAGLERLLPAATDCYRTLEQDLHCRLLTEIALLRLFQSPDELAFMHKRRADHRYKPYLGRYYARGRYADYLHDPFGSLSMRHAAVLNTNLLLDRLRRFFTDRDQYLRHTLAYEQITVDKELVRIHCGDSVLTTDRLIFCEGHAAVHNPWFAWLPFKPARGDILDLESDTDLNRQLLNGGRWLLPTGRTATGFRYRLGATYEWELNQDTSKAARQELLSALTGLLAQHTLQQAKFRVVSQQSGIRPCSHDRQPYVGMHPRLPRLGIFNGFGSKGSLLIPWFSTAFADHLVSGAPLPDSASLTRAGFNV